MDPHAFMALFIGLGICVLVPLGIVGGIVYVVTKRARDRHAERMSMIERGLVPPADGSPTPAPPPPPPADRVVEATNATARPSPSDPATSIGWAVGLSVAGFLFLLPDEIGLNGFGIVLTGIGAGYLTRGIMGLRREKSAPEGEGR